MTTHKRKKITMSIIKDPFYMSGMFRFRPEIVEELAVLTNKQIIDMAAGKKTPNKVENDFKLLLKEKDTLTQLNDIITNLSVAIATEKNN